MAALSFDEAFRTHEFFVEIDNMQSPRITKVSGISEGEVEAIEQADGGDNIIHKVSSGIIKYEDLTLERYMDGTKSDKEFKDWFEAMFNKDGTGLGTELRRSGSVVVYLHKKEKLRFTFEGAWIKSSKFSDLDASQSGLLKQTIVLAVERMYRV